MTAAELYGLCRLARLLAPSGLRKIVRASPQLPALVNRLVLIFAQVRADGGCFRFRPRPVSERGIGVAIIGRLMELDRLTRLPATTVRALTDKENSCRSRL